MGAEVGVYAGPIAVTVAYVVVYYAFQGYVAYTKKRLAREAKARGEKFDRYFGEDREMLAADRIQLNVLEHMGPFLALLWMVAAFVDPQHATIGGALYVLARALYPFLLGKRMGRDIPVRIMAATGLGYAVIAFFAGDLIYALVAG